MFLTRADYKDALVAAGYFAFSTVVTMWFVFAGQALYHDINDMILSTIVAGGKWLVQIIAAIVWLRDARWRFIRGIGFTCFIGSLLLLPFCFEIVRHALGVEGFTDSLIISVTVMIGLYDRAVRKAGVSLRWFWGWIACLVVAISLQLTVVFHIL